MTIEEVRKIEFIKDAWSITEKSTGFNNILYLRDSLLSYNIPTSIVQLILSNIVFYNNSNSSNDFLDAVSEELYNIYKGCQKYNLGTLFFEKCLKNLALEIK